MNKLMCVIAATLLLGLPLSVSGYQNADESGPKSHRSNTPYGISLSHIDTSIKPTDDFYKYANGRWLKIAKIPQDAPRTGAYQQLVQVTENALRQLVQRTTSDDSDAKKVSDFYQSYLNINARKKLGMAPLYDELAKINNISNKRQLAKYFAYANKYRFGGPFTLNQYADFHNPKNYMILTWQSGLGLPNSNDYLNQNEDSGKLLAQYFQHIVHMFSLAGLQNEKQLARAVIALETKMAKHHVPIENTRDLTGLYNRIPIHQLAGIMPNFFWDSMLKEAQLEDVDSIVVTQVDYMTQIDKLFNETELHVWKAYFKWSVINALSPYLTEAIEQAQSKFFDTQMSNNKPLPAWRKGLRLVNQQMGDLIGKLYIEQHFSVSAKHQVTHILDNIVEAFKLSINEKTWLSESAKQEAQKKIDNMTMKVGYPKRWPDYSNLTIVDDDLVGNIKSSYAFHYQKLLDKQKAGIAEMVDEWSTPPHTVNAYYKAPLNEFVLPAAMIQPPYFDPNADAAINYGGIGAVIAHEISHALDNRGSGFDANGVLRNWWSDKDKSSFSHLHNKLINQYNQYEVLDGEYINGELTLAENISDLVGINIAVKAYLISLKGQKPPLIDGYTGLQRVFLSYAQSLAEHARPRNLRWRLKSDPHSPNEFRVNGTLPNVPAFYEAFKLKKGDPMYLSPSQRVHIW